MSTKTHIDWDKVLPSPDWLLTTLEDISDAMDKDRSCELPWEEEKRVFIERIRERIVEYCNETHS